MTHYWSSQQQCHSLLDTPYRRTMARRQLDQELKRRGLPDTRGVTIKIRTASPVEAAKKAARSVLNDSYLTDGEKRWCRRQVRILQGPKDTFLSSSRASSPAKAAKVKEIREMSERKLQEHIRLRGARLVQQRWDVEVRKDQEDMTHEIIEALVPVIRMARSKGSTQRARTRQKSNRAVQEHSKMPGQVGANMRAICAPYERHEGERTRNDSTGRQEQKVPVDHQEMPVSRSDVGYVTNSKNVEIYTVHEARGNGRDEEKTQAGRAAEAAETIGSD